MGFYYARQYYRIINSNCTGFVLLPQFVKEV
jgi:hypothetical protein